jgi:hypothetical protein
VKVLLLADAPDGWIVSRIADRMVSEMPDIEWARGHYCCMTTDQIVAAAKGVDLIHAMNWNFADHLPMALNAGKPILMSVRSHRYPQSLHKLLKHVHVHAISKALQVELGGTYIPDGVMIEPHMMRVGFAGKPGPYKGTHLIEQACKKIGARYVDATDTKPDLMGYYFTEDIDVYCCASEAEGFGAPVMEALACNKPVVSTRTGAAWEAQLPGVTWVDRTVDGIAAGLLKHWPARYMERFTWARVCGQTRELYRSLCA